MGDVPVFVNGVRVLVASGAVAIDAVRFTDAAAASAIERGERALTDSRGLPVAADAPVSAGTILRVVSVRPRATDST